MFIWKWFQPLFENDGAGGGAATDQAGAEGNTTDQAGSEGESSGDGSEGTDNAGTTDANLPKWTAGVKAELREKVGQFKTPTDLAEAYLAAQSKLESAVVLPAENATDEEKAAYLKKIDVPPSPDQYKLERTKLPEGLVYDDSFESWYRAVAHELNLSAAQAAGLFAKHNEYLVQQFKSGQERRKKERDETVQKLKKELGEDEYNVRHKKALRAVRVFGSQEFDEFLEKTGLTDDPRMIGFFMNLGSLISDDTLNRSSSGIRFGEKRDPNEPDSWDMPKSFPEKK